MTSYNKLLEMWRDEKKKRQEVEGENTIIKGIGNNSPEMKALHKENEELKENQHKEIDYHRYWKDMYEKEHKLRQEAEGETTIVKGIGMSSPEMKALKEKNQELRKEICELRNDNRQLSKQIEDQVDKARKAGL